MNSAKYVDYVVITASSELKGKDLMKHANITDIATYLRQYSTELGARIVNSYPPLHAAKDPLSPRLESLLRRPFPGQALCVMGIAKRWQQARAAAVFVTSSNSWPKRSCYGLNRQWPSYG
ncbi:MAG: hypothetical protein L0387_27245 [Acidobacteria bacterium]|nr:hypothetical protein [Acidobacteriota bacterium]MCI0719832.1 hypothetical protein [Acidobacteriota bacterium]